MLLGYGVAITSHSAITYMPRACEMIRCFDSEIPLVELSPKEVVKLMWKKFYASSCYSQCYL